jgi:predicted transposase/invertase (TIGR01784 family)
MFAEALKRKEQEWFKQGIIKGKKEGKIKGKLEGKLEGMKIAAMNMLKEGMDINKISRISGLSVEDIHKLKTK